MGLGPDPYRWDGSKTWSKPRPPSPQYGYPRPTPSEWSYQSNPSDEARRREEEDAWRRDPVRSNFRPNPTSPRTLPPPAALARDPSMQWNSQDDSSYASHWADPAPPSTISSGRGQGAYPSPTYRPGPADPRPGAYGPDPNHLATRFGSQPSHRPGSGGSGYSQDDYSPRGYAPIGTTAPAHGGYSSPGYVSAPSSNAEPRGRKRTGPSSGGSDGGDGEGKKRRNFSQETIDVLKRWANRRIDTLKFTSEEKDQIAREAGLDRNQVGSWYINYHRRNWVPDKAKYYSEALCEAEEAYREAVANARRAAQSGSDEARRAADAEVARCEALLEEIRPKERLAQRDLEEYERRRRGA
ncbi:hypothetical protein VTJ49DRAFT_5356 [Mycothermus thermophilus]|uniref:Homeobox domain-containing protein n=1 Tax=Humicola insolens TaxID=85995 RepID=A0ABR3VKM8_HUMIN